MSNITGDEVSFSSGNTGDHEVQQKQFKKQISNANSHSSASHEAPSQQQPPAKKKRNLPGTPDPSAEVVALSPTTLMATNRFVCEICNKGFQRDQNLQLHRRGHNLPWKLRQRTSTEVRKRVYICPESTCVHHNPARALGDLTGNVKDGKGDAAINRQRHSLPCIKKHYSRKHGEKKWKCDKCSKKYAVQSDWKAHQKTCGTREYKCDCGTIFSRRDSFITHRAFCDALAEENNKVNQSIIPNMGHGPMPDLMGLNANNGPSMGISDFNKSLPHELVPMPFKPMNMTSGMFSTSSGPLFGGPRTMQSSPSSLQLSSNSTSGFNTSPISGPAHMSATALLQKAAQMGATASNNINSPIMQKGFGSSMAGPDQISQGLRSPTYGSIQQQNGPYEQFQAPSDHSGVGGMNGSGFVNTLLQKAPLEMSQMFESGPNVSPMNEMAMFGDGMGMFGEQNQGLVGRALAGPTRFGDNVGGGNNDMTTVDFLGISGSRSQNMHEQQQQQHQHRLEFETMSQQRMQVMNPFQQGEGGMEKQLWDV